MSKQFVKDLKDKDQIKSVFLASDKVLLTDRNGKRYLSLNLGDTTGAINARLWEKADEVEVLFNSGDFIWVKGHVQVYQNRRQIVLHDLRKANLDEYKVDDFIKGPSRKVDDLWADILKFISSVENPAIQQLLVQTINDRDVSEKLKLAPAAKSIHHAYMGGLLEHIVSICQVMDLIAQHYTWLQRDYLIFGAIYHDIGKIEELENKGGIQYSNRGRLVGHMGIALEYIDRYSKEIPGLSEELKDLLKHIVLSHHGKLEYGSPKTPVFPEAIVVNIIDDLDSKLNTLHHFMINEIEGEESWTRYHQGFDRYIYLDLLKKQLK